SGRGQRPGPRGLHGQPDRGQHRRDAGADAEARRDRVGQVGGRVTDPAPATAVRTRAARPEALTASRDVPPRPPAARAGLATRISSALYLLPALALVGVLLLAPFGYTVYQSLTAYDGISPAEFVGLENYSTLLGDERFHRSLLNTLIWTVGTLLLPVILGLIVAVLTNTSGWATWVRYAFVLPYAISGTATAVIWGFVLRSDGALNQLLGGLGLDSLQRERLLSWPMDTIVMVLATTWQAGG